MVNDPTAKTGTVQLEVVEVQIAAEPGSAAPGAVSLSVRLKGQRQGFGVVDFIDVVEGYPAASAELLRKCLEKGGRAFLEISWKNPKMITLTTASSDDRR